MEKSFIVCEKMESDDLEGTVVGWGSTPSMDRDKELIESNAWKLDNYRKNPVLLLCHNYSAPPVGKCLWVKSTSQGLRFKAQFAKTERGKECYELYKDGIMNAFSVGFKPLPGGVIDNPSDAKYKGCKRVFTDVELMEISCVPIPANSGALAEYVKSGHIHTKQLQDELIFALEIVEKNDDTQEITVKTTQEPVVKTDDVADKKDADKEVEDVKVVEKNDGEDTTKKTDDPEIKGEKTPVMVSIEDLAKSIKSIFPDKDISFDTEEEMVSIFDDLVGDLKETVSAMEKQISSTETKALSAEGMPSLYDLTSAVDRALNAPPMVNVGEIAQGEAPGKYKSVVDIFATEYPSGHVVFSQYDKGASLYKYFRVDYDYDMIAKTVSLIGQPEAVQLSWVQDKYFLTGEKDDDDITIKAGRMISGKNKKLLSDCLSKIDEAKGAIEGILTASDADDKDGDDKDYVDIEMKSDEEETIEIADNQISAKDDLFEIDEDILKQAVGNALTADAVKFDTEGMAKQIVAKLTGKATL